MRTRLITILLTSLLVAFLFSNNVSAQTQSDISVTPTEPTDIVTLAPSTPTASIVTITPRAPSTTLVNISHEAILTSFPTFPVTDTPILTSTPDHGNANIKGDINKDKKVDMNDFEVLKGKFSSKDNDSDLNDDGIVNILDFTLLSKNFGRKE